MREINTKASSLPLPSEDHYAKSSPTPKESAPINTSENTVITILFSVLEEHKITIEGIPDLNNDGVVDIKDVIIAVKQQIEKDDSANIK